MYICINHRLHLVHPTLSIPCVAHSGSGSLSPENQTSAQDPNRQLFVQRKLHGRCLKT